jgi:hypothetical protein
MKKRTPAFSVNASRTGTELDGEVFQVVGLRTSNALISEEKTSELIDHMDEFASYGINAFSVFFQGSRFGNIKGYNEDTTLNDTYSARMGRIIEAAALRGMVILLGCLYYSNYGQSTAKWDSWTQRDAEKAIANTITWLKANEFRNVFVDVDNEHMSPFDDGRLIVAGKGVDASYVISASGKDTPDSADLSLHLGGEDIPGKYYIESEGTTPKYWGEYSNPRELDLGTYANIGVYTDAQKQQQKDITARMLSEGKGYIAASTWFQCPPPTGPNHTPGGMGTKDDPGMRWWLEYVKTLIE